MTCPPTAPPPNFRQPNPTAFAFVDPDLYLLSPRVKHANFLDHATSSSLVTRGLRVLHAKNAEGEALRLFNVRHMDRVAT